MLNDHITIITPSYEKHVEQYFDMLESIKKYCIDFDVIEFVVIVERNNYELFKKKFNDKNIKNFRIIETETILSDFNVNEQPSAFLKRVGKFTFQTVKKLGVFKYIKTDWSIVLDSEGLFLKEFSIKNVLKDYLGCKYVIYTDTKPRGDLWLNSLAHQVNKNTTQVLQFDISSRWFMECFHWFYETKKVNELLKQCKKSIFYSYVIGKRKNYKSFLYEGRHVDFFENILYYGFLWKNYSNEYTFYNLKDELDKLLPKKIAGRFILNELPFSLFGNDYLLNIVTPDEVKELTPFLKKFKLPFLRLEPPFFSSQYFTQLKDLPYLIATISSHHANWLRKKIAVCISGEFRHIIHRVPEQQVRMIKSFLSGVECDIFIHGWRSTSEALIINELKPKKYLFEERKDFSELVYMITYKEPNIKPGRDNGSLSMFYSLEKTFKLLEDNIDDYDFVVRIRPDIYPDISLKEILVKITDIGDYINNSIYVPQNFHSKGINDQIAIGHVSSMKIYFSTFSFIKENIRTLFFNPEYILLKNILTNNIKPVLVDIPYALMRELPMRIREINRVLDHQEHVWWSKTDNLPVACDLTEYFLEKEKSMETIMLENFPNVCFILYKKNFFSQSWLEIVIDDNNPSVTVNQFKKNFFVWSAIPFTFEGVFNYYHDAKKFFFKQDDNYVISFWGKSNKFVNKKLIVKESNLTGIPPLSQRNKDHAWKKYSESNIFMSNSVYFKPLICKIIFYLLLKINDNNRKRKLINDPVNFFRDSRFGLLRKFGEFYFK